MSILMTDGFQLGEDERRDLVLRDPTLLRQGSVTSSTMYILRGLPPLCKPSKFSSVAFIKWCFKANKICCCCSVSTLLEPMTVQQNYEYLLIDVGIPQQRILSRSQVLHVKHYDLRCRHLFLKHFKRDQFDPSVERFVPLTAFSLPIDEFCDTYAHTTVEMYEKFQKSMWKMF